jgi:hypothetical protein
MFGRKPTGQRVLPTKFIVIAVAVVVLVLGGVAVALRYAGYTSYSDTDLVAAAQQLVRPKFANQSHFAPIAETTVERMGSEKAKVSGTVDVISPSGQSAQYSYTVLMHLDDDDNWQADDISLIAM